MCEALCPSQAKEFLSELTDTAVADLPRQLASCSRKARPAVSGVHVRATGKFQVVRSGEYRGSFDSIHDALNAVGTSDADDMKKRALPVTSNRFELLRELGSLFNDWIPADIANAIEFRQAQAEFAATAGPLYILAVLGKEECLCVYSMCQARYAS